MIGISVGDWVTWGIIAIIVVAFLRFLSIEMSVLTRYKQTITEIKNIKSSSINGVIKESTISLKAIHWVNEHLVYERQNSDFYVETKQNLWMSKSPISAMLPVFDSSKNKLAPAILTSLGIVGTFLGITLGLSHFNMSGESTVLLASAAELLSGMKTAFYTSLAGLGLSSTFMIASKVIAAKAHHAQSELQQYLTREYFEVSAIYYLKNFGGDKQEKAIQAQQDSARAILALGKNISSITEQFGMIAHSFNSDTIAEKLSGAMSLTIEQSLSPVLAGIETELGNIRDIKQESQRELVTIIMESVKEQMIAPLTATLNETTLQVQKSNEVSDKLNENVANVISSTTQTLESIDHFQQGTMHKLEQFATSLQTILQQFKEETEGAMQSITMQVDTTLEQANIGLESQRTAFEQSAEYAAKAFDTQTDLLLKTGTKASELMETARHELERGLGDIDGKVKSMSSTVQSELDNFRITYQEKLTDYFSQQNNLLETSLGKQRDGLNGVVENFRKVFEEEYQTRHNLLQELTAQYEKLEKSAATIERVAKAIGLNEAAKMAELQDAAQALSKEVGELKREYSRASVSFGDVIENLPKAMDDYFSRANQSFETFFKDFDHSASTIHNKLAQAANYLVTAQAQKRAFEQDRAEA